MTWIITKYLITAAIIVAASEIAKRSDKFGALVVALPIVTIMAMIWMYVENESNEKIANHAWYTFCVRHSYVTDVSIVSNASKQV